MNMRHIIPALFGTLSLMAAPPEPFSVLDMEAGARKPVKTTVQTVDYFVNVPTAIKRKTPFLPGAWNYNAIVDLHGRLQTEDPFPLEKLTMLIPKGEYGFKTFLLRTYAPIKDISLKADALRNNQGNIIRKENILIVRIAESIDYPAANILIPAEMKNIPDKTLAGFAILVNIPEDVPPGIYSTQVTITADGLSRQLPLNVRVPDFKLPETDIPMGCYIPYYASDQGGKEGRWAAKDYTEARQNSYFRFCATRGLNSPTIFHYCPEFKSPDSLEMDFRTQDHLVDKIASAGSCKAILFDLRKLAAHAKRLANLKKFKDAGKDDITIYKTLVKQFCEHAKQKKYPRFYVMAEEEIAYPSNKQKTFLRYGKHMQEAAGDNLSLILDNPQSKVQEAYQDFGHLNGYRFRQYNTWLETTIRQAEKDNAEVWSYNYSYKRPSFGLLLHRLNSRGHHQWADVWGKNYTVCIPAGKGVISSLQYEMAHEGTIDYRCLLALKKNNAELLKELVKDIPIDNQGANLYADTLSVTQNDLLRWRAIMVQAKDVDHKKTAEGTPELKITSIQGTNDLQTSHMSIEAIHLTDDYQADAAWKGKLYQKKNSTGPLRFMLGQERRIRALSSSEEEFRKRNTPSNGNVWVSYNSHGIYLFATLNHAGYDKGIYKDNDTELWKDDCMEYFFMTPDKASHQLIVNSSDAKVLLKAGKQTDSSEIKIVSRPHKGKAGGYAQEVMIPWSVFGLKEKPQTGTVWAFNAGREFHSWRQYTSWARVESSFHEYSRWGALKFSGQKQLIHLKNIKLERLYPGDNIIAGTIPGKEDLKVTLRDPAGKTIAEKMLHAGDRKFKFGFRLLPAKSNAAYTLAVLDAQGKTLEAENIPVAPGKEAVSLNSGLLECASGDTVSTIAELNVSLLEIQKHGMAFQLLDKDGKSKYDFKVDPAGKQAFRIWLKTSGIAPGKYTLVPRLDGEAGKIFRDSGRTEVRIYPAII